MNQKALRIAGIAALAALLLGSLNAPEPELRRIAEIFELAPDGCETSAESEPRAGRLYAIALPGGELAVILRAISEEEYGSYQVQAIAPEMIDLQMLAAALVLPEATEADVAGFPDQLRTFLHRRVNEVSGFAVFAAPSMGLEEGI